MLRIRYADVPQWLKSSDFYLNLSADEPDGHIDIPADCFRATDDCVHTSEDVAGILKTIRFWGVKELPQELLDFCYTRESMAWEAIFDEMFGQEYRAVTEAMKKPEQFSLEVALVTGRSDLVTFWLSKHGFNTEYGNQAITQACRFGRLDLVQTLRERGCPWHASAYGAAAQYGHLDVLCYLYKNGLFFNQDALIFAARGGHLICMKYLRAIGCRWDKNVTMEYAVPAHYHTLTQSGEKFPYCQPWSDDFTIAPPVNGYFECLRYALENGCPIDRHACARASRYGLIDCLKLLHSYGAVWSELATTVAAEFGHFDCLVYLHTHGCPWLHICTFYAAKNGHLECLQYLHQHGCPWNYNVALRAAQNGHLDCLQYLHENGCPWDAGAPAAAAKNGHLHILQYLYEHSCPWDETATKNAAENGHLECLKYLHEKGCVWDESVFLAAVLKDQQHCLKYLYENGCPQHETLSDCAFNLKPLEDALERTKFVEPAVSSESNTDCLQYVAKERGMVMPNIRRMKGRSL